VTIFTHPSPAQILNLMLSITLKLTSLSLLISMLLSKFFFWGGGVLEGRAQGMEMCVKLTEIHFRLKVHKAANINMMLL
jgi:hypothetical protein